MFESCWQGTDVQKSREEKLLWELEQTWILLRPCVPLYTEGKSTKNSLEDKKCVI